MSRVGSSPKAPAHRKNIGRVRARRWIACFVLLPFIATMYKPTSADQSQDCEGCVRLPAPAEPTNTRVAPSRLAPSHQAPSRLAPNRLAPSRLASSRLPELNSPEQLPPPGVPERLPSFEATETLPPPKSPQRLVQTEAPELLPPTGVPERLPPSEASETLPPPKAPQRLAPTEAPELLPPADMPERIPPSETSETLPPPKAPQRLAPTEAPELLPPTDMPERLPSSETSETLPLPKAPQRLEQVDAPERLPSASRPEPSAQGKSAMRLPVVENEEAALSETPSEDASDVLSLEPVTPNVNDIDEEEVGVLASGLPATITAEILTGIEEPQLEYQEREALELHQAIQFALMNSPEITLLRSDVGIAVAEVTRQDAAFDWATFVSSTWNDRNSPVGSSLDGAQNRLLNRGLDNQAGLRQSNQLGGSVEVGQIGNLADSNSQFFIPTDQAIAQLGVVYEQPLLQGGGGQVARSRFAIAVAQSAVSKENFVEGLQVHLLNTINAYWDLASTRATFAIRRRNFERAETVAGLVTKRTQLDVGPAQLARAEATLASRKTELLRSEYAVLLAQERLMRLMLGPSFDQQTAKELVPTTEFLAKPTTAQVETQQQIALRYRPEVRRAIQQIKQASIEQGVAKNQLLPALGLTLSMSNRGLAGDRQFEDAFNDQFTVANATYGVGLAYELPIGNRAAKANFTQSKLRASRLQSQFQATVADVTLEVRNAAHSLALSTQELELSIREKMLAERELNVIETRYALLVDGDAVGIIYLDNLLQTQERLAAAELRLVQSGLRCKQAEFELQRATGLLLRETAEL